MRVTKIIHRLSPNKILINTSSHFGDSLTLSYVTVGECLPTDTSMKEEVNKKAFDRFAQSQKSTSAAEQSAATERFDSEYKPVIIYRPGKLGAPGIVVALYGRGLLCTQTVFSFTNIIFALLIIKIVWNLKSVECIYNMFLMYAFSDS